MMSYESGPVATTLPYHIAGPQSYSYTRESAHQPGVAVAISSHHQHTRSSSSTTFPYSQIQSYSQRTPQNPLSSSTTHSRQPSSSSITTTPVNNNMSMHRAPTSGSTASSTAPRRSTSSRSSTGTSTPTSYVALMRKQKATVWCDRSQSLDARTVAAQRAAKHRAIMEVHGAGANPGSGRTSTISSGGVVGKIRHGGVPKAPGYLPTGNLSGAGVPMRLSANEMLGDEEEGSSMHAGDNSMVHGRSGSGRSSTNSVTNYRSGYPRPSSLQTPSGNQSPRDGIPEVAETGGSPRPNQKEEYFNASGKEEEDGFGSVGDMNGPSAVQKALSQAKNADDLRRRGSVDERAMSMGTGVRLFVANPDVDD